MYRVLRPLLFRLEPETAHRLTLHALSLVGTMPPVGWLLRRISAAPPKPVKVFGLEFQNPVGLAAGYDKDGLGWRGLACLGFGHIEIGTVTLHPQQGNSKPRLFRLEQDQALINRMGFPGKGAEFVAVQLKGKRPPGLVLGVNIGKNKDTPIQQAASDYVALLELFAPLADYLAINVSSPNTVGLRRLQARDALEALLAKLAIQRQSLLSRARNSSQLPILVKLAPDLTDEELEDALGAIMMYGMDGIIATNTTLSREGVQSAKASEAGGLSGTPLTTKSRKIVSKIVRLSGGTIPVIGVGGIMNPEDAQAMLDSGAALVQLYTGLVFSGPALVKQILTHIIHPGM